MPDVLFLAMTDRESQIAYKLLMQTKINFKPFPVRGKNVKEQLKTIGITKVPTFVLMKKRKQIIGAQAIQKMIEAIISKPPPEEEEIMSDTHSGPPQIPRRDDSEEEKEDSQSASQHQSDEQTIEL
jgi:hypothetical protein